MSVINTFENWYKTLSTDDQSKLISHIIENHLQITNEGLNVGPSGLLTKGLYVGPAGSSQKVCNSCGRVL